MLVPDLTDDALTWGRETSAWEEALEILETPVDEIRGPEEIDFDFSEYADDPLGFCSDVLGVNLWDGQREVVLAVRGHWKVFVRSGHSVGKTFVFACLTLWNLYARRGPVVTTGPSKESVQDLLWAEIHALRKRSLRELPALRTTLTSIVISEELYAKGKTSSKSSGGVGSQGKHHPRLMVLIDEAYGVDGVFWEPLISQVSDPTGNRIAAVGNPTDPSTAAAQYDRGGQWHRIRLSCLDHPNIREERQVIPGAVSPEMVKSWKHKGEEIYHPRALGKYPPQNADRVLVPYDTVMACARPALDPDDLEAHAAREEARDLARDQGDHTYGVDIGTLQDDTVVADVYGGWWVDGIGIHDDVDTTWVEGHLAHLLQSDPDERAHMNIDASEGQGLTIGNRLQDEGLPVTKVKFGQKEDFSDEDRRHYKNERARMLWTLREMILEQVEHPDRDIISLPPGPATRMLATELSVIRWKQSGRSRIYIEPKKAIKSRLGRSPDVSDALALAFRPVRTRHGSVEDWFA